MSINSYHGNSAPSTDDTLFTNDFIPYTTSSRSRAVEEEDEVC